MASERQLREAADLLASSGNSFAAQKLREQADLAAAPAAEFDFLGTLVTVSESGLIKPPIFGFTQLERMALWAGSERAKFHSSWKYAPPHLKGSASGSAGMAGGLDGQLVKVANKFVKACCLLGGHPDVAGFAGRGLTATFEFIAGNLEELNATFEFLEELAKEDDDRSPLWNYGDDTLGIPPLYTRFAKPADGFSTAYLYNCLIACVYETYYHFCELGVPCMISIEWSGVRFPMWGVWEHADADHSTWPSEIADQQRQPHSMLVAGRLKSIDPNGPTHTQLIVTWARETFRMRLKRGTCDTEEEEEAKVHLLMWRGIQIFELEPHTMISIVIYLLKCSVVVCCTTGVPFHATLRDMLHNLGVPTTRLNVVGFLQIADVRCVGAQPITSPKTPAPAPGPHYRHRLQVCDQTPRSDAAQRVRRAAHGQGPRRDGGGPQRPGSCRVGRPRRVGGHAGRHQGPARRRRVGAGDDARRRRAALRHGPQVARKPRR